jgi:hypothetical protein
MGYVMGDFFQKLIWSPCFPREINLGSEICECNEFLTRLRKADLAFREMQTCDNL